MFSNSIKQIKKSVLSGITRFKRGSSDSISIRIVTDPYTGDMTLFDGSDVLLRSPGCSGLPKLQVSHASAKYVEASSTSSSSYFERSAVFVESSASNGSMSTVPLSPNSRLFRGSQDEFGFDVYITHDGGHHHGPAYLFDFPTILPWNELVSALAAETNRAEKDIVLSSKFYSGLVNDDVSYEAWLSWSRNQDGPCGTDLWLV